MSSEITVHSLGDAVRDRVRATLFSAIPDEAINALIASELSKMTTPSTDYYTRGRSELQQIVEKEMKKQFSERMVLDVTKYIDETYKNQSKELVQTAIKELAPIFMAGMMESFAANAVQALRNQLNQKDIYL